MERSPLDDYGFAARACVDVLDIAFRKYCTIQINYLIAYLYDVAGKPDDSLHEVFCFVLGIFEHDHVTALRCGIPQAPLFTTIWSPGTSVGSMPPLGI